MIQREVLGSIFLGTQRTSLEKHHGDETLGINPPSGPGYGSSCFFPSLFSSMKRNPSGSSARSAKEQEEKEGATCTQFQLFHQFLTAHLQAKVTQMS